jgi:cytochrome c biogenesis protein CcmG/thiol:disulfide interchange protein DsbE
MGGSARFISAISVGVLLVALGLISVVNLSSRRSSNPLDSDDLPYYSSSANTQPGTVAAGKMAANFNLKDINGTAVSLSALRGKVIFLNVWATWCAPCREEMPSIQSLYNEFKKDKDFVVLAVSQDTDSKAVPPYVKTSGLHFTVLLDPANDVGESYGVNGIPETFIIGRDGRIVAHHVGPYDWANPEIRQALLELIKSKQG